MNPYELLEVPRDATTAVIRRAYRRLARRWHPDRNPDDVLEAERRFKQIGEAYRILSDPKERHLYDLRHSSAGSKLRTLWDRLREQTDPESRALVMLWDLCHDREMDGFKKWEELRKSPGFRLDKVLGKRDYRDCCFLLAEQLAGRGRLREAAELYHAVYFSEHREPLMPYYKEETRERLWDLLTREIPRKLEPEVAARGLARALCYAETPGQRRKLLKLLSDKAYTWGFEPLAARAARGFVRQGGKPERLKVRTSA